MHDVRHLLRKRFFICVVYAVLLIVFSLSAYFIDRHIKQDKQSECDQKTQAVFDHMVDEICSELNHCKLPAIELVQRLQEDSTFNFHNEEQVYLKLEQVLRENPILSGAIMCFEDWAYPQYAAHNGFGPLVRRVDEYVDRLQIGEFRDFRSENEWYQRQLQDPIAEWSKPFLSDDGVMIATYTLPLFEKGRYMGGFGIDIDLSRFANHIDSLRPYASSVVVVVDADLNILIHPNRSYIGTTTLADAMARVGINPSAHPLHHSQDRQSGVDYDYLGQHRTAFYYAPITETNWMVLLYCNTDEIYSSAIDNHDLFMVFTILVILFLLAMFGLNAYRYGHDYYKIKHYEQ